MGEPGTSSAIEQWAIVAMCVDVLRARAVQDELKAEQIRSRREIYDLHFGGPVVKVYVPARHQKEGVRIASDVGRVDPGLPPPTQRGRDYRAALLAILAADKLVTRLGLWAALKTDPAFKKEHELLDRVRRELLNPETCAIEMLASSSRLDSKRGRR